MSNILKVPLYCIIMYDDRNYYQTCLFQSLWDPTNITVLIIQVSLFQRYIYTHLYCNGTTTDCPYYRGVLISQVHLYTFIIITMGPQLTVFIIEVSLLQIEVHL